MKICKKCGCRFSNRAKIDGKRVNLQNRKYCLECSPYGRHNTRRIHLYPSSKEDGSCISCGRKNKRHHGKLKCYACYQQDRMRSMREKAYSIVGKDCWLCGYDKYVGAIDFHHVDEDSKLFSLTASSLTHIKWEDVEKEMRKCVRLCSNCHREYHGGLIEKDVILKIYNERWTTGAIG